MDSSGKAFGTEHQKFISKGPGSEGDGCCWSEGDGWGYPIHVGHRPGIPGYGKLEAVRLRMHCKAGVYEELHQTYGR